MNSFEGGGGDKKGEVATLKPQSFFDWDKIDLANIFFEKEEPALPAYAEESESEFDLNRFKYVLLSLLCNPNLKYHKLNTLLAFVFIKRLEKYENAISNPKDLVKFVAFTFISELNLVLDKLLEEGFAPDEDSLNFLELKTNTIKSMDCEDSIICASNIFTLLNDQAMHFVYDSVKNKRRDFAKAMRGYIDAEKVKDSAKQMLQESKTQKVITSAPQGEEHGNEKPEGHTAQIISFPRKDEE